MKTLLLPVSHVRAVEAAASCVSIQRLEYVSIGVGPVRVSMCEARSMQDCSWVLSLRLAPGYSWKKSVETHSTRKRMQVHKHRFVQQ